MAKPAYTWDEYTQEYKGVKLARNKSSEGEYLLPGKSTWEKPPEAGENEVAEWDGKWIIKPDYRRQAFYNTATGERRLITEIGQTPAVTETEKEPAMFSKWDGTAWVFDKELWLSDAIRPERNGKLAATDWTQLADAPLTAEQVEKYATYRQKLRDLPEKITFEDPVFPVEPK